MSSCTFAGNMAGDYCCGGAIYNSASLTVNQTTFTDNSADLGGAIFNTGNASVSQSTLAGNTASQLGGGIYNSSTITIFNTIVAGNTNLYGLNIESYYGTLTLTGISLTNGNPMLAPLANYGGPTPTMPPLPGSPAIDAGDDSATNSFATDQRGLPRLSGLHVDIGEVELRASNLPAQPVFGSFLLSPPASFHLQATGTPNLTYTLQTSSNLVDWVDYASRSADTNGLIDCLEDIDTNAPASPHSPMHTSSGCATFSPSDAEKGIEAEREKRLRISRNSWSPAMPLRLTLPASCSTFSACLDWFPMTRPPGQRGLLTTRRPSGRRGT